MRCHCTKLPFSLGGGGSTYVYPPTSVLATSNGVGSELQAQNNAFMIEAKTAMEAMRQVAGRGAHQGVGQTQLLEKVNAAGA